MKKFLLLVVLSVFGVGAMQAQSATDEALIEPVTEELSNEEFPDMDTTIAAEFDTVTGNTFMGSLLYDQEGVMNLLFRFLFNLIISWILIHFGYYRIAQRKDWYLTFMLFSSSMFMLIYLMGSVKLEVGFIFGLFAIFGVIRYRTEAVPIREMTYMFVIICMSVMNGLAMTASITELVLGNVLLLVLCFVLEAIVSHRGTQTAKIILYDKIELIVPEKREELLADLRQRTGIDNIDNIEIGHVDFLRDVAYIKIYYALKAGEKATINDQVKPKN